MMPPPAALRAPARLFALRATGLLDSEPEEAFDRLTRLAARLTGAPMALVSLVGEDRQFLKSARGLPEPWRSRREVPLSHSYCQHVVADGRPLVVADARAHAQLRDSPAIADLGAVAYAGVPLATRAGDVLGTLCVLAPAPREWGPAELEVLRDLGAAAATEIDLRLQTAERRRAEETLRATLEATADGILVLDQEARITGWNREFLEIWRIPEERLLAPDNRDAIRSVLSQVKDPGRFEARIAEVHATDSDTFDVIELRDGRVIERYTRPQRLGGRVAGRVASFRDVTSRRQLEEQLRQAQKMEAVGRLAGGIAHDFNNLLTVIKGHADLLAGELDPGDPHHDDLEQIRGAATRAAGLTRQLLAFGRKQLLAPRALDLGETVRDVEGMLRRLIGEDVDIVTALGPRLGTVMADAGQLEQVLMNLAVNARDAMPGGGRLVIETANVRLDGAYLERRPMVGAGEYVMLAVSDTGVGMDAQTAARAFEPFFTTKEVGRGTGLGLATVYGIVKQSGGYVWCYSEPGMGTTFKVYLPRVDTAAVRPAAEPPAAGGGSETVLLVEDEPAVRRLAARILTRLGYRVMEAPNGRAALDLAERHEGPIHLVLTDAVMPEMSGAALSARLADVRPEARVLFMSGYTDDDIVRRGVLRAEHELIQKPFTADVLARRVREVLDRTPGAVRGAADARAAPPPGAPPP
ncbi:MAG TPA: ATP-binding protein [Gemmatimonadaceae bacterium]|nr:ATP-binding protein [Gemmatimonadaceae bacterium]